MSRTSLLVALLLSLVAATGVKAGNTCTTCYIDYENGNDSWDGTAKTYQGGSVGPWKHLPGMSGTSDGCTATCASQIPQAGDRYILKGGVVWPYTVFPLNWSSAWAGTGSTSTNGCAGSGCVYIGIDPTWNKGMVNSVVVSRDLGGCPTNPGRYSVSFVGGGGNGAAATVGAVLGTGNGNFANGGYEVGYFNLTSRGGGYTSAPSVGVSAPGCIGLKAVADIQRAIFDGGKGQTVWGNGLNALIFNNRAPYVIWDNIEIRNVEYNPNGVAQNFSMIQSAESANVTFSNLYVHNWNPNPATSDSSYAIQAQFNSVNPPSGEVTTSYVSNAENAHMCRSNQVLCSYGTAIAAGGVAHDNHASFAVWMLRGTKSVHDNEVWANVASDVGGHTNMLYLSADANDVMYIYNNLFYNNDAGSSSQMSQGVSTTWYIFNNVSWYCGAGNAVLGIDTNNPAPSGNSYFFFFNNTFQGRSNGTSSCFDDGGAGAPNPAGLNVSLFNNICITDQSNGHWWNPQVTPHTLNGVLNPTINTADSANLVISPSQAVSQGYTFANMLAPTSPTNLSMTFVGANFTSTSPGCGTANLAQLCADILGHPRPAQGSWRAGAYYEGFPKSGVGLQAAPH